METETAIFTEMEVNFPELLPATDITSFRCGNKEKQWSGPFTFIQGADTQFGMIDSYIFKKPEPNWDKEIFLTRQAIQYINHMHPRPRFFVVCGDLLDSVPFKDGGKLETRQRQYADFVDVFKILHPDIKLICVCGNHDIGDDPTPETLANYRREFGPDYYSFWCGGVKFVVLNSQFFKSSCEHVQEFAKAHEEFMKTIPDESAKHIVVFQHIPFFIKDCEEDCQYFCIDKPSRKTILDQLHSYGVRYIFCGHYHRNAGGFYKGIDQVVTTAVGAQLGNDKSGFRIVAVEESKVSHQYFNLPEELPSDV